MQATVALGLCVILIWALLKWDKARRPTIGGDLWLPILWIGIVGSRPLSLWLHDLGIIRLNPGAKSSPIDTFSFLALEVLAVMYLQRKQFPWIEFVKRNKILIFLYLYLAASALWSEIGVSVLKKLVKDFSCVLIALILLWRHSPMVAMRCVFIRVAFVLVPLSFLLAKYYPDIGRKSNRSWDVLYVGVATDKNGLGLVVMIFGLFVLYEALMAVAMRSRSPRSIDVAVYLSFYLACVALILFINCFTALVCLCLGTMLMLVVCRPGLTFDAKLVIKFTIIGIGVLAVAQSLRIPTHVAGFFGRDLKSMTGRSEIWELAKSSNEDSLFGSGYYSFWQTESGMAISSQYQSTLNTVHSGFREMYLDGGLTGLFLLSVMMLSWVVRVAKRLHSGSLFAGMSYVFLIVLLVYNISETGFFRISVSWVIVLAFFIDIPRYSSASGSSRKQYVERDDTEIGLGTYGASPCAAESNPKA